MKKRYAVLGAITALLPNLYAYAGETTTSASTSVDAGGSVTHEATQTETTPDPVAQTKQSTTSTTTVKPAPAVTTTTTTKAVPKTHVQTTNTAKVKTKVWKP